MKLSEVVDYLNLLESRDLDPAYNSITGRLDNIEHSISNHSLQFGTSSQDLARDLLAVKAAIGQFDNTLQLLKQKLRDEISQQEPVYYQDSLRLYEQDMIYETTEYILDRRLRLDFETDNILRSRLKSYGDWRLPGMIIRPGRENFIEDMVPLDPLYVVDNNMELMHPAISGFTPEYQRRLRPYTINDYSNDKILYQLPNNQFGVVFAYNYFNFRPIEIVEKFLHELYQKLRPGGVVIFTYNECDLAPGIGAVEHNWMCYTPGRRIRSIADSAGYEIVNNYIGINDIAWFELKKPGEIESLRGGQTLAKIVPK